MVRFLGVAILSAASCATALAADPVAKAGGVAITLPGPTKDFVEAGDKLRTTFFELLVPATNRLITAYVPLSHAADVGTGKIQGTLDIYGIIEVARQAEYTDCTPEIFEGVRQGLDSSKNFDSHVSTVEQELNSRLKTLSTKQIEIGKPAMLGTIFKKQNAAAIAMLMAFKQENRSVTMAAGIGLVRVRQRLLFTYLYRKYESADSVTWLRKSLEIWDDAILAKNK